MQHQDDNSRCGFGRMPVLVTGADGFVGRRVVAALVASGSRVVAASRRPFALEPSIEWRKSPDLGREADWSSVLDGAEVVIHAAARVHVMDDRARDPLAEFRRVNVDGTAALACQAAAAGVRRFVFVSTIKVNGESTSAGVPFTAFDRPSPVDPYAISKWEAECALADISSRTGMETASIRPVLVYGPGVKGNMATLARIAASGLPVPLGAVRNRRSLVYVDNLAGLIAHAAAFQGRLPPVMLARDDDSISTRDLLRRLARAGGHVSRLPAVPLKLLLIAATLLGRRQWSDRLLSSLEVDDDDCRQALGWVPPVSLDDGLIKMMTMMPPDRHAMALSFRQAYGDPSR